MSNRKIGKDWYKLITKGVGITVCTTSLLLFIYLISILMIYGPDLVLAGFFLVSMVTFAVGLLFINLSGLETIDPKEEEGDLMARRIGVLSDTHGLLRPEVSALLQSCDCIIHAGDIGKEEVLDQLKLIAPLYIVKGNVDTGKWSNELDELITTVIGGVRFLVVHDKKYAPKELGDVDVVICGHSHKYACETIEHVLWLNPGSCGKRRFHLPITMAVLEIGEENLEVKKYTLGEDV